MNMLPRSSEWIFNPMSYAGIYLCCAYKTFHDKHNFMKNHWVVFKNIRRTYETYGAQILETTKTLKYHLAYGARLTTEQW